MAEVADITDVLLKSTTGQNLAALLRNPAVVKHFKYLLVRKTFSAIAAQFAIHLRMAFFRLLISRLSAPRLVRSP